METSHLLHSIKAILHRAAWSDSCCQLQGRGRIDGNDMYISVCSFLNRWGGWRSDVLFNKPTHERLCCFCCYEIIDSRQDWQKVTTLQSQLGYRYFRAMVVPQILICTNLTKLNNRFAPHSFCLNEGMAGQQRRCILIILLATPLKFPTVSTKAQNRQTKCWLERGPF